MILADIDIVKLLDEGELLVTNFEKKNLRPNGIRVHLSKEIIVYDSDQIIDMRNPNEISFKKITISERDGYLLLPNEFVLLSTREKIKTPKNIVGYLEGRSTIARLGIAIHCTSGVLDSLYEEPRSIVLEVKNNGPLSVRLYPDMPIGMILFHELTNDPFQGVQSQYLYQEGATLPNLQFKS